MTRTDDDTWDLASSVGATATMVAAARAAASKEENPLIDDPYAEPLVQAVGIELFNRLAAGELPAGDDGQVLGLPRMTATLAVRTKFFDEFFLDATDAGIRQAVILASGLDSRPFRLNWPDRTVVYEIDQPEVIEFKDAVLTRIGAAPTCERRALGIDLRNDWVGLLTASGFDPAAPAVWSAEGLLGYLPPDAQDRLLDAITALSAPGSRVAIDSAKPTNEAERAKSRIRMKAVAEHWREQGFHLDLAALSYQGDRNDVIPYLEDRGWRVHSTPANDLLIANGRNGFDEDEPMSKLRYLVGVLA